MSFVLHDDRGAARRKPAAASPALALGLAALFFSAPMVAAIMATAGRDAGAVAAGLGVLAFGSAIACRALLREAPHDRLGIANAVTLSRLALVGILVAHLAAGGDWPWTVAGLATLALTLDGVDGWIARRQGMTSRFGARFDMEVDCAFALVLAIHAAHRPDFGIWVLLLGLPRYAFCLVALTLPWLLRDLPDRLSRKTVCVLQIATLIALQLPVLPTWAGETLIAVALIALGLSFGRDILWLWRRRA